MRRTTIVAPDDLIERLRQEATERKVSLATIIREALEEKVQRFRRKPRSLGIGDSGRTDIGRRTADEPVLPESWR
jgi:predicted transcriptional regulator